MSTHPVAVQRRRGRRRNAAIITSSLVLLLALLFWGAVGTLKGPPTHMPDTVAADTTRNLTFQSPTKSVTCQINDEGARCVPANPKYAPPVPNCPNNAVQIRVDAQATVKECAATFDKPAGPLAYGDDITRGDYTCQSRPAAIRCLNTETQHGFSVSPNNYIDY